ncbi:hypothetical protein CsSME_00013631 [Camellia sinensis var. sinensis]
MVGLKWLIHSHSQFMPADDEDIVDLHVLWKKRKEKKRKACEVDVDIFCEEGFPNLRVRESRPTVMVSSFFTAEQFFTHHNDIQPLWRSLAQPPSHHYHPDLLLRQPPLLLRRPNRASGGEIHKVNLKFVFYELVMRISKDVFNIFY